MADVSSQVASEASSASSSDGGETKLLPLEKAKSGVWIYFGFAAKNGEFVVKDKRKRSEVFCKLCRKQLHYVGNTTNLLVHMQYHHASEYSQLPKGTQTKSTGKAGETQRSITEAFQKCEPLPRKSQRWKRLTAAICYCIAKDSLPLDSVTEPGFRSMLQAFEPRYIPPDRKYFSTHYMIELYQREKAKVTDQIGKGMSQFAITTDAWSSRANHSYISCTVHYITDSWKLQSHLLDTAECSLDHTGVNLASELETILTNWNMCLSKLSGCITDNASNILSAMCILEWSHFRCFGHTLQLAVKEAMEIPQVSRAIGRAKRLVGHFHHSSKSTYVLRQKQSDLKHDQLSLVQDVSTRWNSSYFMLKRILVQQQPICAALIELRKTDLMPSETEFQAMEIFVQVMEPIAKITAVVGAEKWITISAIRPLLHKLLRVHLAEEPSDSRLMKTMKKAVLDKLRGYYTDSATSTLLDKSCFLDPRFRTLPFLSHDEREVIMKSVQDEALELADLEEVDLEPPATKKPRNAQEGIMSLLSDVMGQAEAPGSPIEPEEKARREVQKYALLDAEDGDPIDWWRNNQLKFPLLSALARKYLCIPATSVPSERVFSTAGHIVNAKRASLLPENVSMLVFLAENLD